jgi:hypothetical protein
MLKQTSIITVAILLGVSCGYNHENANDSSNSYLLSSVDMKGFSEQQEQSQSFQDSIIAITGGHYQSCAPLLNPSEKPKKMISKYFEEAKSYTTDKCEDRRDDNIDYVSFSKGSFEPNAGRLKDSGGKIDSMQRFNCSGFVAATMSAGGLKYYKSQDRKLYSPRTHDITKDFKRSDSCFFRPTLSKETSILPGDILNVSYGHVVRVLTVGKDPLGLKGINKKSDCDKISQKNFDFTFVHSTSNDKTPGLNGVLVENAKDSTTSIISKLAKYTEKLCKKKFKKNGFKGEIKDQDISTTKIGWGWFSSEKDKVFSLRRHYGSEKDSCTYQPVSVKGDSCLSNKCFDKVIND